MKRIFIILVFIPVLNWNCTPASKNSSDSEKFQIVESDNQIKILIDGKHFTTYRYDSALLKPILFPVYSPSGIRMQRQYPLQNVEGESHDHPHHAGVSFTYGSDEEVNGNSFWAAQEGLTRIHHSSVVSNKISADKALLEILADWVGYDGEVVLTEDRTMVFTGDEKKNSIDFTFLLKAKDKDVVFKDTKEGMFGIRVADWLSEEHGNGQYLSSSGDTTEANIWGKRAKWVRLESQYEGKKMGIIIMNHLSSVNYPTYWHARGYGLFAANPLGQLAFQEGRGVENPEPLNFTIPAGESAIFRFKLILYEGDLTVDQIESAFEEYR